MIASHQFVFQKCFGDGEVVQFIRAKLDMSAPAATEA